MSCLRASRERDLRCRDAAVASESDTDDESLTRSIPPSLAPVLERLELDDARLVTTERLAELLRQAGVRTAPRTVAARLRDRGWLLATDQRGVWEFAPAALAGAHSRIGPAGARHRRRVAAQRHRGRLGQRGAAPTQQRRPRPAARPARPRKRPVREQRPLRRAGRARRLLTPADPAERWGWRGPVPSPAPLSTWYPELRSESKTYCPRSRGDFERPPTGGGRCAGPRIRSQCSGFCRSRVRKRPALLGTDRCA
jgi:hypothetical protein